MAGRPRKLDEAKQREICALLAAGCDRQTAARYVGCNVDTIRTTAKRDADFAEQLRRAEVHQKVAQLGNIQSAGKKSWRASAWILERRYPQEFARRSPDTVTREELADVLRDLGEMLGRHVTDIAAHDAMLKELELLITHARQTTVDAIVEPGE